MNKGQPVVVKGKLKLKGSAPSSSSQASSKVLKTQPTSQSSADSSQLRKRKFEESNDSIETLEGLAKEVHLTDAQKRFKQKQQERETAEAKKLVGSSYRERINQFNERLSKLTEHNDIPRVSAAGNG